MDNATWLARRASGNPIFPYQWVARYSDGSALSQFDVLKRHNSRDIDLSRVTELVILNHPASPLVVPAHLGRPHEVIVKAEVEMDLIVGTNQRNYRVTYLFGFRYGVEKYMMEINDGGAIYRRGENVAGQRSVKERA